MHNTTPIRREEGDRCSVCFEGVSGGFEVREGTMDDGTPVIAVDGTADQNFNVCDACNDVICFRCSVDPASGLCNRCLERGKRDAKDARPGEGWVERTQ